MLCAICESTSASDERLIPALSSVEGTRFLSCSDPEALLESAAREPPDIVVYALRPDAEPDLSILQILRRILPRASIILVSPRSSMALQRRVQVLRPIYFAVAPVAAEELAEAVRSAIDRSRQIQLRTRDRGSA